MNEVTEMAPLFSQHGLSETAFEGYKDERDKIYSEAINTDNIKDNIKHISPDDKNINYSYNDRSQSNDRYFTNKRYYIILFVSIIFFISISCHIYKVKYAQTHDFNVMSNNNNNDNITKSHINNDDHKNAALTIDIFGLSNVKNFDNLSISDRYVFYCDVNNYHQNSDCSIYAFVKYKGLYGDSVNFNVQFFEHNSQNKLVLTNCDSSNQDLFKRGEGHAINSASGVYWCKLTGYYPNIGNYEARFFANGVERQVALFEVRARENDNAANPENHDPVAETASSSQIIQEDEAPVNEQKKEPDWRKDPFEVVNCSLPMGGLQRIDRLACRQAGGTTVD